MAKSKFNVQINNDRLAADFEALSSIGATPDGGVNRLSLSPDDIMARAWFADRIEAAGLRVQDDDAGNLSGILRSPVPDAKTLLIGSHLDTVPNGGRYDGAIGLLAGLECLRCIREANIELPVNLEVINWTDDEGCWRSLFGVSAFMGVLAASDLNDIRRDNAPFRAALTRAGIDPRKIFNAYRTADQFHAYLELHIEQGSRLEYAETQIGVVTGIVGRTTYTVTFHGQAGHSGTTDMYRRRDALRGAALFITRAHDLTRERFGAGVFNCGDVTVLPGSFNVIPSEARLIVELRHIDSDQLAEMESSIVQLARECAASNALTVTTQRRTQTTAVEMSAGIVDAIQQACTHLDLKQMSLASYSGHAAQITAKSIPSGMIFIPSVDGISHHPREFTHWDDVVNGANVLLQTILLTAYRTP